MWDALQLLFTRLTLSFWGEHRIPLTPPFIYFDWHDYLDTVEILVHVEELQPADSEHSNNSSSIDSDTDPTLILPRNNVLITFI